jgi:cyanophycinase
MTTSLVLLLSLLGAGDPTGAAFAAAPAKGTLVVDGGGKASLDARKRILELAGGAKARIVVVPQASNLKDIGTKSADRWREVGAENLAVLDVADPARAVATIDDADLVWITGGEQERLMGRLAGTGVVEAIRRRYESGAVVGGTSAGAAVMSEVMIARSVDDYPRPLCQYPLLGRGMGLWSGVIVDQHFTRFRRGERLKRALAEYPDLIGVGIDESTVAIVRGRSVEVAGLGKIFLVDGRRPPANVALSGPKDGGGDGPAPPPTAPAPMGWRVTPLNPGVTLDLDRGMIVDPIAGMP